MLLNLDETPNLSSSVSLDDPSGTLGAQGNCVDLRDTVNERDEASSNGDIPDRASVSSDDSASSSLSTGNTHFYYFYQGTAY